MEQVRKENLSVAVMVSLSLKKQIEELQAQKKDLDERIKGDVGDSNTVILDNGIKVSVSQGGFSRRVNSKTLKNSYPEIYESCLTSSATPSRLTITVPKEATE